MTLAQQVLTNSSICDQATNVQFFTRSTVYDFADGSRLTVNMYGRSYAE